MIETIVFVYVVGLVFTSLVLGFIQGVVGEESRADAYSVFILAATWPIGTFIFLGFFCGELVKWLASK